MRSVNTAIGMLLASVSGLLHAQEINFTALPGAATPGLGELVYDAGSDRIYIASGAGEIRVVDRDGMLDTAFAVDGIIGNDVGEAILLDAEYLAISGNLILAVDQEQQHIQVINAATGALDLSIGTDGIIGNDAAEPDFSAVQLHDIEILDNQLYIATNSNVIRYLLDGSDTHAVFSAFPAQTLHFGPLSGSGNCSDDPFGNGQLLYAVTPNEINGAQGTVACLDSSGTAETLAQTGDISLTDLVFAPSAGDSCASQTRFNNGSIAYLASRRVDTELRCMGSDGSSTAVDDAVIGASTGITVADNALYIREAGLVGRVFRSDTLNQIPVVAAQMIALDENTTTPLLVTTATATDGDPGAMLGNWMIQSGNDSVDGDNDLPFSIDSASGEISINDPGDLDRELAAGFELMVTVSDGLDTSSAASILISLNDLNEFDPQIDAFANLAIDENPAAASLIATATGSDQDATAVLQNWTIVAGNVSVDGDMDLPFSIDSNSGEIRVNDAADLDRELAASFTLEITVSDGEVTSSTASLMITLNDVNEFVPVAVSQTLDVDENPANSSVITAVIGSDGDATALLGNWTITSGNNSVDGDADLPFAIDPASGQITVNDSGDFDRELTSGFSLTVTVSDGMLVSDPASIVVNLNDINKFTPVIDAIAPFDIDENPTQGGTLLIATAVDDDATAVLQDWTIVSGNSSPDGDGDLAFAIDPDSGEISFNDAADIDRELVASFTLSLTVSDGENTSEMVGVSISINDLNEFEPIIDAQTLSVDENPAANSAITVATAVDDDATSVLSDWTITAGNDSVDGDADVPFAIDPDSGQITVNDSGDFDRELTSGFSLSVTVSDGSFTADPEIIVVNLNDVNKFTPVIDAIGSFAIDENPTQGATLLVATAVDDDATAVLQDWTIVSGNSSPDGDGDLAFAIDPDSGEITFNDAADVDRELVGSFTLSLTVSDGDNTSAAVDFTITLNDINEFDPVIDVVAPVLLNKGDADGTPVVTMTAVDEDATSALLDWTLVSGNIDLDQDGTLPFAIDPFSGLITITDNGDFDVKQIDSFDLSVTVSDGSRTSAERIVTILLEADTSLVIAANDNFTIAEGDMLNIPSPGVLANDEDENGGDLVVDQLNGASGLGQNTVIDLGLIVNIASDGSLQLDASNVTAVAEGQSADVTFSYRASNGSDDDIATVTVSISGRNDAPVAEDDLFALLEDQTLSANVFNDNGNGMDRDPDQGQAIAVVSPELITLSGLGGTLSVSADGQFQYRPPVDTTGTAMFDYTISDGTETASASVVIDVTAVNDPPTFSAGSNQFVPAGTTGMQMVPGWASDISAGPNEGNQTVQFSVTPTSDPSAVVSAISVTSDGTLDYSLSGNLGLARFDVSLMDDGGIDNGGQDTSEIVELIVSNQDGVELVASISDGRQTVEDGETLTYVIVIRNDGPDDALGADISVDFPAELINVSWTCIADTSASCPASGSGDIDEPVDLPVGTAVSFSADATVSGQSGIISTTVSALPLPATDEILPENNSATDTTIIGEEVFSDGFEDPM